MRKKTKVLYVLHNHPTLHPGGAEAYALELYEALRESEEIRARCWWRASARTWPPPAPRTRERRSARSTTTRTSTSSIRRPTDFDFFTMTSRDKSAVHAASSPSSCARTSRTSCTSSTPSSSGYDLVSRGAADAARRADRLHAARVPADLPPRRPDGAHERRALQARRRRGAATSASRRSRRRSSSCASASSSPTSTQVDMFLAPEPVPARALRRLGHPARPDPVRGLRPHPRAPVVPDGATRRGRATARVLRPAQPLQGRRTCCWRRWSILDERGRRRAPVAARREPRAPAGRASRTSFRGAARRRQPGRQRDAWPGSTTATTSRG